MATNVAPTPFVVVMNKDKNNTVTLLTGADSTVAVVHYKSKKNRAEHMKRNEKIQSSHLESSNAD